MLPAHQTDGTTIVWSPLQTSSRTGYSFREDRCIPRDSGGKSRSG